MNLPNEFIRLPSICLPNEFILINLIVCDTILQYKNKS